MLGEKVNPLPNILTTLRLIAGLFMFTFMMAALGGVPFVEGDQFLMRELAFFAFIFAASTDFFDGFLARKLHAESEWGAILDPISDKILVAGTILGLAALETDPITTFPLGFILFREFAVSALRESAASKGVRIKVIPMAKWKTVLQMLALAVLLLNMCRIPFGLDGTEWSFLYGLGAALTWVAALMTIWTGFVYFLEARKTIWAHDIETHTHH